MAKKISASVGKGGRNKPADVLYIQQLLNCRQERLMLPEPLKPDGIFGPKTRSALDRQQRLEFGVSYSDPQCDPDSRTVALLEAATRTQPSAKHLPSRSVTAGGLEVRIVRFQFDAQIGGILRYGTDTYPEERLPPRLEMHSVVEARILTQEAADMLRRHAVAKSLMDEVILDVVMSPLSLPKWAKRVGWLVSYGKPLLYPPDIQKGDRFVSETDVRYDSRTHETSITRRSTLHRDQFVMPGIDAGRQRPHWQRSTVKTVSGAMLDSGLGAEQ